MPVSEKTFQQLAMEDPDRQWELACGRPRRKPLMTTEHNGVMRQLYARLFTQLDQQVYAISVDTTHVRIPNGDSYVPDVFVLPRAYIRRLRQQPGTFEVYADPMPPIVEVWSPSTGNYDVEAKLKNYQTRGDLEIWHIHPYEHTLTTWRRQPDGSYTEDLYRTGTITPIALPGVTITIDTLFDE
jgi:Uma2 family endonuclease